MRAELKPLVGKYYGTEVEISDGRSSTSITLWFRWEDGDTPSVRELEPYSLDAWNRNTLVDDGWGGKEPIRQSYVDYSHCETQRTLEFAAALVDTINGDAQ